MGTKHNRLNLVSLVRKIDYYISERLEVHHKNGHESLVDELKLMAVKLDEFLTDRCKTRFSKGKNKGCRCLRSSDGDRCKTHARSSKKHSKVIPRRPLQNYYNNPDKELTHLYDDVYLDRTNTVVIKNTDATKDHKWTLVCKYNRDEGVLSRFSRIIIDELKKQKLLQFYNYIIDESCSVYNPSIDQALLNINNKEQSSYLNSKTPLVASSLTDDNPSTPLDKVKYYNKYLRAPNIQVVEEPLMSVEEFNQYYNKQWEPDDFRANHWSNQKDQEYYSI